MLLNLKTNHGDTPLHIAISSNDLGKETEALEYITLLLDSDVNIDEKDREGNSLLIIPCEQSYEKIAKLLLTYGACTNTRNKKRGDNFLTKKIYLNMT